mmetsp:Transcript_25634/g.72977  ORF Transcript_25634/g.72977 Transcript_25634/m.72977 type:complete len:220 (-) Transcript_25634:198-857(-)
MWCMSRPQPTASPRSPSAGSPCAWRSWGTRGISAATSSRPCGVRRARVHRSSSTAAPRRATHASRRPGVMSSASTSSRATATRKSCCSGSRPSQAACRGSWFSGRRTTRRSSTPFCHCCHPPPWRWTSCTRPRTAPARPGSAPTALASSSWAPAGTSAWTSSQPSALGRQAGPRLGPPCTAPRRRGSRRRGRGSRRSTASSSSPSMARRPRSPRPSSAP